MFRIRQLAWLVFAERWLTCMSLHFDKSVLDEQLCKDA